MAPTARACSNQLFGNVSIDVSSPLLLDYVRPVAVLACALYALAQCARTRNFECGAVCALRCDCVLLRDSLKTSQCEKKKDVNINRSTPAVLQEAFGLFSACCFTVAHLHTCSVRDINERRLFSNAYNALCKDIFEALIASLEQPAFVCD